MRLDAPPPLQGLGLIKRGPAPSSCLGISPLGLGHASGANPHRLLRTPLSPQVKGRGLAVYPMSLGQTRSSFVGFPLASRWGESFLPSTGPQSYCFLRKQQGNEPLGVASGVPILMEG